MIEVHFLRASNGDCFLLRQNETYILIDSGTPGTYNELRIKLNKIKKIDLMVITHIDNDHIGGAIKLLENENDRKKIKKVFFNSGKSSEEDKRGIKVIESTDKKSFNQGVDFERKLIELNLWNREEITNKKESLKIDDIEIEILLPFKSNIEALNKNWDKILEEYEEKIEKDKLKSGENKVYLDIEELIKNQEKTKTSIVNESSIVLLIKAEDKKLLFTGDTSAYNLMKVLKKMGYSKTNPIKLDLFKVPHHGSKNNITKELIEMIDCKKYLISTNGISHGHPDKEALAKIIDINKEKNIKFFFNYASVYKEMFSNVDKKKYGNFECKCQEIIQI